MTDLSAILQDAYHKPLAACTPEEIYGGLVALTLQKSAALPAPLGKRRLYYLSAEFLLGRLLGNNLLNLGLYDKIQEELAAAGHELAAIEDLETEPSLGNGGLGRLAACFLDAIATLGLPGCGIGICYHLGLFRQVFRDHHQQEIPGPWITPHGFLKGTELTFPVTFGRMTVMARQMDMDALGYGGGKCPLYLYDIETADPDRVKPGTIDFDKGDILHNLTLFLYPDDSDEAGRLLRVYQQVFLVSCAAQRIFLDMAAAGQDVRHLHEHAIIQINDTHPALIIPELIRRLTEAGIPFDRAATITAQTCAYTNHTILAEALEKWPLHYIEEVAPHLVPILQKLDAMVKARYQDPALAIIDGEDRVHMAHLAIHFGCGVNGVAALHTEILKSTELRPFYDIYPEKFHNKTNGITLRRWLLYANPALTKAIEARIGPGFKEDATALEGLLAFQDDNETLQEMMAIKSANKQALRDYLFSTQGLCLPADAIYDIQIKRFHEYKRQQMNALYIIHQYLRIKGGHVPGRPITLLFGGKAAPAYRMAKDIIHLILCLQQLIQGDDQVRPHLQVFLVENYGVTLAEKLIPACDISEQISLSSKEASGTGNMKFMVNGAVTLGTLDGANVEIHDLVGDDNIFLFGKHSENVMALYREKSYYPGPIYRGSPRLEPVLDFILGPELSAIGDRETLFRVYKELVSKDWFMTLLDAESYFDAKERALLAYEDRLPWAKKMLVNTAMAGFFSADRTIGEYNRDLWHLERVLP